MFRAAIPCGTNASPPHVRPVCRRCGTLRGRIAHATLFSGTRPRCRTRQEWKYTGTRASRLTRRSAIARSGAREMRPRGRVAHYMDTLPEVTPFASSSEIGSVSLDTIGPVSASANDRHVAFRVAGVQLFRVTTDRCNVSRHVIHPSIRPASARDSLRPHRSRGVRKYRKLRSMAGSASSAAYLGSFRCAPG